MEALFLKMVNLSKDDRRAYSTALFNCSVHRRRIAACPLAFGEVGVKDRIRSVMNYKKPAFWIIIAAIVASIVLAVCFMTNPINNSIDADTVLSVSVDGDVVPGEAADELISLLNSHDRSFFVVGLDDPNKLSRAIQIDCEDGGFYLLHYQYYSGFSFNPFYAGEDDYRSILTYFPAGEKAQDVWKMEYAFDSELKEWLSEYTEKTIAAFDLDQSYGVEEVTYESPLTDFSMVAQANTPTYTIDENGNLSSLHEFTDEESWTVLGDLSEVTLTKDNFDESFRNNSGDGWFMKESASAIRKNTAQAWNVIYNQDTLYYILLQENGEIYLATGYYDYSEKDDPGSDDTNIRWLFKLAPQVDSSITELIPGTSYVSWQCLYMNPLSSYSASGGNSGCRYIVGEDKFVTIDRSHRYSDRVTGKPLEGDDAYLQHVNEIPKWEWQEFPYTDEEWAALYKPGIPSEFRISALYDEILYQPLTADKFLLRVDGTLWLVELSTNPQMGTYLWSIYSLIPESTMGSAQWEYAPELSSSNPVFRFEFDMDYEEISAVCTESNLVDFIGTSESGPSMTIPAGKHLWWSPVDKNGNTVSAADIHFSIHKGGIAPYAGTIYITRGDETGGVFPVYTATIVGTGLHLEQNTENEGGLITALSAPTVGNVFLGTKRDLASAM